MSDFFDAIRRFLLDYLPKQRCLTMQALEQSLSILDALREHSERAVEYKVREEGA